MKENMLMSNTLCKYKGMLVIMEVTKCKNSHVGKCPECGATDFYKRKSWIECDCGFAVDKKAYNKIMNMT